MKCLFRSYLKVVIVCILVTNISACKKNIESNPEKFSSDGIPWAEAMTKDGGMLIGINTGIVRIDAEGANKWIIELNNNNPKFYPTFLNQMNTGEIICIGFCSETNTTTGQPIGYLTMVKISEDGKELWRKVISDRLEYFKPESMEVIDGGDICISAVSNVFGTAYYHFMKFDTEGNLLRYKDIDKYKYLVASKNTDLYINDASNNIIRMDSSFQEHDMFSMEIQSAIGIQRLSDGFIVYKNSTDSFPVLTKYNITGVELWSNTYTKLKHHQIVSLSEESDGSLAICGTVFHDAKNTESFSAFASKDGNIRVTKKYRFEHITKGFEIFRRNSNGYFLSLVTGKYFYSYIYNVGYTEYRTRIIKLDNDGTYLE